MDLNSASIALPLENQNVEEPISLETSGRKASRLRQTTRYHTISIGDCCPGRAMTLDRCLEQPHIRAFDFFNRALKTS
uniref:PML-orf4 n=1 Tax=Methanohalophilus mahii TaxID=2176 RepID=Q6QWE2_9EURY|nr:pML-orf4 [Methanohalophilus mahii]